MAEYDRTDADLYDLYQVGVEGDVAFYVEEARRAGGPVLEIGCGTGRIVIATAAAGVPIVGLDRAPAMLQVARRKLAAHAPVVQRTVDMVEGDMREFALGRRFSLITIPFRAFLHNLSVEDQRRTLTRVREHLSDDGRLVLNVFDPRLEILVGSPGTPRKRTEFMRPETGRRVVVSESFRYDLERQIVDGEFVFEEVAEDGSVVERRHMPLTLRWVYRYEMQHLLELSGFSGPFRPGGEQIWVVRPASG